MSTLRADGTAKPQDYVRELKVGGHDVVEDQWRGETDSVTQVLLNNQLGMNPGLVCVEAFTLAGSEASVALSKDAATLLGVQGFQAGGEDDVVNATGPLSITGATINGSDASQIDLAGTADAGVLLVWYTAL